MSEKLREVLLNVIQSIVEDYTAQLVIAGAVVLVAFVGLIIHFWNNNIAEHPVEEEEEPDEFGLYSGYEDAKPKHTASMFAVVGMTVAVLAVIVVYPVLNSYVEAREEYEEIAATYTTPVKVNVDPFSVSEINVNVIPSWYKMDVDFDALCEMNSETVGWLTVDGIDIIDYPIVQADDDDKYLHQTFNGTMSTSGAIFLKADSKSDMTDSFSVIYGHNMRDGSMFGSLKRFTNEPDILQETGGYFTIYTRGHAYRYLIFSVCTISANDEIYYTDYKAGTDDFRNLLNRFIASSEFDPDIVPNDVSRVITLSTCSYSDEVRFTVTGMLMERYPQ